MTVFAQIGRLALAVLAGASLAPPAAAEMVLSQVVVDLPADKPPREDIEVWNAGPDRIYVLAEPFEVIGAGTAAEARVAADDPDTSGLLVSPRRMILEPGERRALRIALIADRPPMERVYRVAIKPVAGDVTAPTSALNIFVGYDALILVRPAAPDARLEGERTGRTLLVRNTGTVSQELFEGTQCAPDGADCRALPGKRLYPGAVWHQPLPHATAVRYKVANGTAIGELTF